MTVKSIDKSIREKLISWFETAKRPMPWRETKDPYAIWISEVMLQQTQVKTVIPYFVRWMKAYPDVSSLAKAQERKLLKLWQGLGYYSRALNLRRSAKIIRTDFHGEMPDNHDDLIALPGIGRYTAGAIMSIAYGQPLPVLDGNVKRVLSRLFCLEENGSTRSSEDALWTVASRLVCTMQPGEFNQALMELGATVCLPKKPLCLLCPLSGLCQAGLSQRWQEYPPPKVKKQAKKIVVSAAVLFDDKKVYIQKRPLKGLMGGLWEFPGGKLEKGETPEIALRREIKEEIDVGIVIEEKIMIVKHAYTQFLVTLHVFLCRLSGGRLSPTECEEWRWVEPRELKRYPFPAANVKIVKWLEERGQNG